MNFCIRSSIITLVAGSILAQGPVQWDTDAGGNGHYYQIVPLTGPWTEANAFAITMAFKGLAGHLVTITSRAEADFIESALLPGGAPLSANYWIGFTDQDIEGDFEWVTDEAPSFTNWAEGEPNDFGSGEDFAAIRWTVTCEDEECTSEDLLE